MIDSDNILAEYIIYIVSKIYSEKENVYFDLNSLFDWSINKRSCYNVRMNFIQIG